MHILYFRVGITIFNNLTRKEDLHNVAVYMDRIRGFVSKKLFMSDAPIIVESVGVLLYACLLLNYQ